MFTTTCPTPTKKAKRKKAYDAHKEGSRLHEAAKSRAGRDIGQIPEPQDLARRELCRFNLRLFCEIYFPLLFYLPWSPDHLKVIAKIEKAVLQGGLFAVAMPRGDGKSTLAEIACIWAAFFGHRCFIVLIGSDEGKAGERLDAIKVQLSTNELLLADFPEAVYPIHALQGLAQRCKGQLHDGEPTHISWRTDQIILPTIKGSEASGVIIRVAGLTGSLRGMKFTRPDGRAIRPDFVIPDDPQTDESARSVSQCATREAIIKGAVLGLAGPKQKIAAVMPCTVIAEGDLADRFLDRERHPEWNGERTQMVYEWPTNEDLWHRYQELRRESFKRHGDHREATEFYRQNREAMDAGAIVSWPERFDEDELSAVQHAINKRQDLGRQFASEYQNKPERSEAASAQRLKPDDIAAHVNGYERGQVPLGCNKLTHFIDVQGTVLYYAVAGWENDFTGCVLDYGAYPDQGLEYFSLAQVRHSYQQATPSAAFEGALFAALKELNDRLMEKVWRRDDGAEMKIDRGVIDANWSASSEVVYAFCRQSAHYPRLVPSHGRFIGASSTPMGHWAKKPGEQRGIGWTIPPLAGGRPTRHISFDANYWKSFIQSRLATALGDRGCLSLFRGPPDQHRMIADHLTAEYPIQVQARGRTVDEWKQRPGTDNHLSDCLVGAAVAAATLGVSLECHQSPARRKKPAARRRGVSYLE